MLATALSLALAAPTAQAQTTVVIPYPRDPGTLTPLTFKLGYPLVALVYDTLTWRDDRAVARPWLARSIGTADEGRRVVVELRRGVRWHDGEPLTAADVAFTYNFMRARRHPRFAPQLRAIQSVRALDADTVEFQLRHGGLGFLDQPLADVPILPEHLWRGLAPGLRAPAGRPIGSGPYRVAGRGADGELQLRAVPDYFRGRPRAERIEVPIEPDADLMLAMMRRGRADTVPLTLTPTQAASVESISIRVARGPLYLGTMLLFNTRSAPFHRAHVRRAIDAAIDRHRIARATGSSVPATTGFARPGSPWAPDDERVVEPGSGRPLAALDLPEVRVLAPENDPVRREVGRQVVLALRRAGARAQLVEMTRTQLGRAVGEGGGRPRFDLAIWTIPALASNDPDYLAAMFGSGEALNRAGYASPQFDRLAERVAAAPTRSARRAAIDAQRALLERDVPAVPLTFPDGAFAYRSTSPVGWSFVAGSGILDKRSLLRPARKLEPRPRVATAPLTSDEGDGTNLFAVLAAGMLAVALLLAGAAAVSRRRV